MSASYEPPPMVSDSVRSGIKLIGYAVRHATWQDWLGIALLLGFVAWIAYERWRMEQPSENR